MYAILYTAEIHNDENRRKQNNTQISGESQTAEISEEIRLV